MTKDAQTYADIDVIELAKQTGAKPEEIAATGVALFEALIGGSQASQKVAAMAAKNGGLNDAQMATLLQSLAAGFGRKEALEPDVADRISAAGQAIGSQVSDTYEGVKDRIAAIDLGATKDKGVEAINKAAEALPDIDLDEIKGKAKKFGDSLRERASKMASSVTDAVAKRGDDGDKKGA